MPENQSNRMSQRAYAHLKEMIIRLDFPPGAHLEESELMERLNVGRTPLREALQLLSKENLVTNIHRRGYFVSNISVTDPQHVFEVRRQLEFFSARLAAERAGEEDIAEFHEFLEEMAQNVDTKDFNWNIESDRRFHQMIAKATENPFLQEMLDQLFNQCVRVLNLFNIGIAEIANDLPEYREILHAIENHNPDEAVLAMQKHLIINFISPAQMVKSDPPHPEDPSPDQ